MTRMRRVDSERELEDQLDEFITKGYSVKQRGQYSARVKDSDWGEPPIHGFLFLFSLLAAAVIFDAANVSSGGAWIVAFLANVGYAAYSRVTAEEILIKVDQSTEQAESDEV